MKRYSSGMYIRLAFSVAAHVRADLLLIDEVLSVGDMAFQQKSQAKMNELRNKGATIVFVSHNLPADHIFTDRVLLLNSGRIAADGAPGDVIEKYRTMELESWIAALEKLKTQHADVVQLLQEVGNPDMPLHAQGRVTGISGTSQAGIRDLRKYDGALSFYHRPRDETPGLCDTIISPHGQSPLLSSVPRSSQSTIPPRQMCV